MTARELIRGVSVLSAGVVLFLGLGAILLAGAPVGLGVLSGGGLALANFLWLARGGERALALASGRQVASAWILGLGLRYLATFGAFGLLLWSGRVDPVGVVAGLTVLPPLLIASALYNSREAS
ncbi:MAG: ATP synthase subunit I [Candidatus Methylomirabilia bacterium]